MTSTENQSEKNFSVLRGCLSDILMAEFLNQPSKPKKRSKNRVKGVTRTRNTADGEDIGEDVGGAVPETDDIEALEDFVDYLTQEIFQELPSKLQTLSYSITKANPNLVDDLLSKSRIESLSNTLPGSITDSLAAYSNLDPNILTSTVLSSYVSAIAAPPPIWVTTRTSACEICERDWVPLTYHHLIPRSTHEKVLKRAWHEEWELNKVAWLCGACHRCVHRVATNEELARQWHSVEKLKEREDIRRFAAWVGDVRWKKR